MPPPVSPPKTPYVPTPRNLATSVAKPQAKSSPPAVKADKLLAGVVAVVVVAVGLFYVLPHLSRSKPKPQSVASAAAPVVSPASKPAPVPTTAPKLVDNPVSAAGKTIASARDVVAAHDSQEKEITTILEGAAPTAKTPDNVIPATVLVPPVPAAPVVPPPPPPPPPPTDAFRQFVVNLRVNGIFQGENARAMLNNKMVFPGDVVNAKLAITLLRIDVDTKQLIFRDDTGATVTRRF